LRMHVRGDQRAAESRSHTCCSPIPRGIWRRIYRPLRPGRAIHCPSHTSCRAAVSEGRPECIGRSSSASGSQTHVFRNGPRIGDVLPVADFDRRHSDFVVSRLLREVCPDEVERALGGGGLETEDTVVSTGPIQCLVLEAQPTLGPPLSSRRAGRSQVRNLRRGRVRRA